MSLSRVVRPAADAVRRRGAGGAPARRRPAPVRQQQRGSWIPFAQGGEIESGGNKYPLIKKWVTPCDERVSHHPFLDEPIVAEFDRGTFCMCNERYPSIERVTDQFFPGMFPRVRADFDKQAVREGVMTTEELMLEQIGLWNITQLVREYATQLYTGAKLSMPMQWEVAGIQDLLPEYYGAYRKLAMELMRYHYSFWQSEVIVASPKYKVGGIIPQVMHFLESGPRKFLLVYISCHPDFSVYPEAGETRYAVEPLDFLLYSHLNYYHVLLNIYKYVFVQEGWCQPQEQVGMAHVNFALTGKGEVEGKIYTIQTDDRVREALEMRYSGVGPAHDALASEWFDRKELWREEELSIHWIEKEREQTTIVRRERNAFMRWKNEINELDEDFRAYLEQQARELAEDKKRPVWRAKNWMWHHGGGYGPLTRDMI